MHDLEPREWHEVSVVDVRRSDGDDSAARRHVVVLRERDGDGELPIWVGHFEATAIALSLEATETPRPMTYQFASSLVTACGSRVSEVRITGLAEGVFYATVVLDAAGEASEVDGRPSDAINLALVAGAPIRVETALLAGVKSSPRADWQEFPDSTADITREVRQQQERGRAELARINEAKG